MNISRLNVVGYVEWKKSKDLNELLKVLEKTGYLKNSKDYYVLAENFGLSFAIIDLKRNSEFLYLTLNVEPTPELSQ